MYKLSAIAIIVTAANCSYGIEHGKHYEIATFAGGCFWCMEAPFEQIEGVQSVTSGYTGGNEIDPSYNQVSSGMTTHREAIRIVFDPAKISYEELLSVFWRQINPTDAGGQFADRGPQYQAAIFYHDETQKRFARVSKKRLDESNRFDDAIVTPILKAGPFYEAEEYHQDFYLKNPVRYKAYKMASGREEFLKKILGDPFNSLKKNYSKPSNRELRQRLTAVQYRVTQENGTEPAFKNEHWNNKREGIYVDIVSGEPLFSSHDKFDSGTGWPSFTKPLVPENIVEIQDISLGMVRVEVRSKAADSHLGHVFEDGPSPLGLRYCINSSSLAFIPKDALKANGLGHFLNLFE